MKRVRDWRSVLLLAAFVAAAALGLDGSVPAFSSSSASRNVSPPSPRPIERLKVELSPPPRTRTTKPEEEERPRPVELADDVVPSTTSERRRAAMVFCPLDAKMCSDGSSVSRDPNDACRFPPCSEEEEEDATDSGGEATTVEHHALETSLVGTNGSRGTMFDVFPIASVPDAASGDPSPIRVVSLDVHVGIVDPDCSLTVYTRVGTHLGYETNPSAWTKIVDDGKVDCAGMGELTTIPPDLFGDDPLEVGSEGRAFYVSMDVPELRYDGVVDGGVGFGGGWNVADKVLGVRKGSGLGGPFRDVRQPRVWNGAVHYSYERPSSDADAADDGAGALFSGVAAGEDKERNEAVTLVHGGPSLLGPAGFVVPDGCESELTTTYDDNTGSYGNMFTVRTKGNNVVIHGMDIYTDVPGKVDFEIYTKEGPYEDVQSLDEWTLLSRGSVVGAGLLHVGAPIPSEGFQDVAVGAYSRQSFYLTLSTPDIRYRNTTHEGLDVGDVHTSNPDMDVLVGHGVAVYPLDVNAVNAFYTPRAWAGTFRYTSEASCPTSAPSDPPTTVPTRSPVVPPPTPECTLDAALTTPMEGGTGAYGNMFDVRPVVDLTIFTLEFYTDLRGQLVHAEVYEKRGSYRGHERTPASWKLIAKATVRATGPDRGTLIPDESFTDVVVPAGEVRAFYVTLNTTDVRYTFGSEVASTYVADENLEILEGNGVVTYPFGESDKSFYEPRRWNGAVRYRVGVPCPTQSPTMAPTTLPPTSYPTTSPTLADDVVTDVTFTFFVEHLRQVDADTVLDTVSESVEDQLKDILQTDEGDVGLYRKEHGLAVSDVISKEGTKLGEDECKMKDPVQNVCTAVDTSVTLTHRPSVLSGGVVYNLLKFSDQLTETLDEENDKFVTTYEGDRAVETKVIITVAGVPGFMGERETQYFEQVVNSFLQGVLNPDDPREVEGGQKKEESKEEEDDKKKSTKKIGMDIIPVTVLTVDAQHQKIVSEDKQARGLGRGRRLGRRRRTRELQVTVGEIDDADRLYYVDVTTRIGGEYRVPPGIAKDDFDEEAAEEEFDRKVSEAIEGFSKRLVVDMKSKGKKIHLGDKNDAGDGGGGGGGGDGGAADDGDGESGTADDLEAFFGQVEDVFVNKVITGSPTASPTGSPVEGQTASPSPAPVVAPIASAPSAPVAAVNNGTSPVPRDGPEPILPAAAAEEEEEAPSDDGERHEPTFLESFLGIAVIAAGCSLTLCLVTACLAHRRKKKMRQRNNDKGSLRRLDYDGIDDDIDDMYRRETDRGMKRLGDGAAAGDDDGPPHRYNPDLTIGAPPKQDGDDDDDDDDGWREHDLGDYDDAGVADKGAASSADWRKGRAAAAATTDASTASSSNRSRESFHDEMEPTGFDTLVDRGFATPEDGRRSSNERRSSAERRLSSGEREGFRYDETRRSSGSHAIVRDGKLVHREDPPNGERRGSGGGRPSRRSSSAASSSPADEMEEILRQDRAQSRSAGEDAEGLGNRAAEVAIGRQQGATPSLSKSMPPKTHQALDDLIVRDIERRRMSMDDVDAENVAANIARRRSSIGPTSTAIPTRRPSDGEPAGPSVGLERQFSSREQRFGSNGPARRGSRDGHDPRRSWQSRQQRSASFRRASIHGAGRTVCSDPDESQRRLNVDDAADDSWYNTSSRSFDSGAASGRMLRRHSSGRHSSDHHRESSRTSAAAASYDDYAERVKREAPARRSSEY